MYKVKTKWNVGGPLLPSLRSLIWEIKQTCPPNHKIADVGLVPCETGLELIVYFQET